MTETISMQIKRWPKPPSEGGPGGVFTDEMQMAEALSELHTLAGFKGTVGVGDGLTQIEEWQLSIGKDGHPQVPIVKFGVLIAYVFGILQVMTADEYAETSGSQP